METLQEGCLLGLLVTSFFMSESEPPFNFDWDELGKHVSSFGPEYNFNDAKFLLQLSLMISNANMHTLSLNTPSWLTNHNIMYDTCPVPLLTANDPNNKAMLANVFYNERANIIFIVFTGTYNSCLIGVDMEHAQNEIPNLLTYSSGMKAHRGIYAAYQSIRPKLLGIVKHYIDTRKASIIITGHSLGGALSQLCALDLAYYSPLHYSFGSPLIFNPSAAQVFNKFVTKSYRIANLSDLITLSPLPVMPNKDAFCHVGKLIHFQRNLGDYIANHSRAYAQEFQLKIK